MNAPLERLKVVDSIENQHVFCLLSPSNHIWSYDVFQHLEKCLIVFHEVISEVLFGYFSRQHLLMIME